MDSHYSSEFLSGRQAELMRQKKEVEEELGQIARFDAASGSWAALQPDYESGSAEDTGESGDESQALQEHQAQVAELEKTLVEIDNALAKFASNSYGRCESTGDWITEDRLMAYPAARTCTDD